LEFYSTKKNKSKSILNTFNSCFKTGKPINKGDKEKVDAGSTKDYDNEIDKNYVRWPKAQI